MKIKTYQALKGLSASLFLSVLVSTVIAIIIYGQYLPEAFFIVGLHSLIHGLSFVGFGAPLFLLLWNKDVFIWRYSYALFVGYALGAIAFMLIIMGMGGDADYALSAQVLGGAYGAGSALISCFVRKKTRGLENNHTT